MNEVYETETFTRLLESSDKKIMDWVENVKDQLVQNLQVGKPLRYDWFREKKLGNKRLFYIINKSTCKALLVALGNKKEQQKIIDHIIVNQERYINQIS